MVDRPLRFIADGLSAIENFSMTMPSNGVAFEGSNREVGILIVEAEIFGWGSFWWLFDIH